tara:strand:- start:342 stop:1469 length:1128 start_codon:yes stop_codon:yes gene_type:complete
MAEAYNSRINFKEIVFANSPQYLSLEHLPDGAVGKANSISAEVYVWVGDKGSIPGSPTYTLNQKASTITAGFDNTFAVFEVAGYIKEVIEQIPVSSNYNTKAAVWFKIKAIADTSATYYDSGVFLATLGYGDYTAGANPGVATAADLSKVMFGVPERFKTTSNIGNRYSFYIGEDSNLVSVEKVGETALTPTVGSTLSNRQFFSIDNPTLNPVGDESGVVKLVYNTSAIKNYYFESYSMKSQGVEVVYFDRYGVQVSMQFMGRADDSFTLKRKTYTNILVNRTTIYDPSEHNKKTFNIQRQKSVSVNTGLIEAGQVEQLKDILNSYKVWFINSDGDFIPVSVKDTNFNPKSDIYDKLHDYTFNFEVANPDINQVT